MKILEEASWLLTKILAKDWPPTRMEVEEARTSALKLEAMLCEYLHRDVNYKGELLENVKEDRKQP